MAGHFKKIMLKDFFFSFLKSINREHCRNIFLCCVQVQPTSEVLPTVTEITPTPTWSTYTVTPSATPTPTPTLRYPCGPRILSRSPRSPPSRPLQLSGTSGHTHAHVVHVHCDPVRHLHAHANSQEELQVTPTPTWSTYTVTPSAIPTPMPTLRYFRSHPRPSGPRTL